MSEDAVGFIILGVNGDEYDCASFSATKTTGNRPIATMNRTREAKYKSKGVRTYALTVAVVIPDGKDQINWLEVSHKVIGSCAIEQQNLLDQIIHPLNTSL